MKRARDLMQRRIVTLTPFDSLEKARQVLESEEIHGAPVVGDDGEVLGVLSLSDLVAEHATPGGATGQALASVDAEIVTECVGDVMTVGVVRVPPHAPVAEVAGTMRKLGVHRVLVMDGKELLGVLSSFDLLTLLEEDGED